MTWFTSCVKNDIKHDTIFILPLNSDPSRPLTPEGFAQVLGGRGRVLAVQTPARPLSFPSDRGTQFVSSFIKDFYAACGISGTPSTAYHPQTDGQTKRVNQELEIYLRFWVNSTCTLRLVQMAVHSRIRI